MSEPTLERRRLHPATLVARWLKIVPQLAAGGIAIAATATRGGFGAFLYFALIGGLAALGLAFLFWWRFHYSILPGEIVIEKGLFQRQRRVIPFDRIQDIAIEQKLLARLFGTAKVRIETGGAAADEGNLDMIAIGDAHALRDLIRRGPTALAAAGAEATAAEIGEPVLFEMDLGRLLLSGLFNFSLIFIAAIVGLAQYLEQLRLIRLDDWLTPQRAGRAAELVSWQTSLGLVLLILALGVIAGVARTVARDYGFRLTRTETGLRRRRGLFTLSEVVIPIRRTQAALIESGFISRRLGWYRLSFQTLGADRKERGVQVAAPFARSEELLPILAEAGFAPPPPRSEFHGIPKRALLGRAGPWLLAAILPAAAAIWIEPLAAIGAPVLLLMGVLAILRWRRRSYHDGASALFVSDGLFRRRLWILPYEKTQAILVSRGPVQRALRLASVVLDTAGAPAMRSPVLDDLDRADAETIADRLLDKFRAARAAIKLQGGAARSPA